MKFHGYDPKDSIIQVQPRNGEYGLRTEDILKTIKENGNDISLILFSGVQYYTGQLFDMETITKAGHQMVFEDPNSHNTLIPDSAAW